MVLQLHLENKILPESDSLYIQQKFSVHLI